jgi:Putative Actinobacterial Holin-X, holin superfamily III
MEKEFKTMEETIDHLKSYVNTKISQAKLGAAEKASDLISVFVAKLLAALVLFFFIFFISLAVASALGDYFEKPWLGYTMVAGFYLLAGFIIWFSREKLLRIPIMNAIITRLFRENLAQPQYEKN